MNAFFIVPTSVKETVPTLFATHPPHGEADRAPAAARGPAPGPDRRLDRPGWASSTRSSARSARLKQPAPDRLFAMTTAQVTLETVAEPEAPRRAPGIVFQPLATADFEQIVKDTEELLAQRREGHRHHGRARATTSSATAGSILRDPDFEDLVVAINTVSSELEGGGYGDRLLVRGVRVRGEAAGRSTSSTTSSAAPTTRSCPTGDKQRDTERELAAEGPDRRGAADRGGAGPLVPALGDPALARTVARISPGSGRPRELGSRLLEAWSRAAGGSRRTPTSSSSASGLPSFVTSSSILPQSS